MDLKKQAEMKAAAERKKYAGKKLLVTTPTGLKARVIANDEVNSRVRVQLPFGSKEWYGYDEIKGHNLI